MKFVVLMENTAPEGACLSAEAGLALYIEYRGRKLLLDAGSSGKFADNAAVLGIDLSQVELAVLSHGHYDHSDGLRRFFVVNQRAKVYARTTAGGPYFSTSQGSPRFIGVHRDIWEGFRDRFVLSDTLSQPMEGVWLVPETVHGGPFASQETNLLRKVGRDQFVPDDFSHEQSLVLEGERGLVVFNSCSHGGIVNIVQGVRDQLQKPVCAVVGGLHMFSASAPSGMNCTPEYARGVADALLEQGVERVYTGHCTGPAAFAVLKERLGDRLCPLSAGLSYDL